MDASDLARYTKLPSIVEIAVVSYEPDDDVKEKKLVTLNSEVIPFYLEKLDDIARENDGHMANSKVNATEDSFSRRVTEPFSNC